MFATNVLVQLDTKTRFVRNLEVAVFVKRAVPLNDVLPVGNLDTV